MTEYDHDDDIDAKVRTRAARRAARREKLKDEVDEVEDLSVIDLEDFYDGPAHPALKMEVGRAIHEIIRYVSLNGSVDQAKLMGLNSAEELLRALSGEDIGGHAALGTGPTEAANIARAANELAQLLGFRDFGDFRGETGAQIVQILDQNRAHNGRAIRELISRVAAAAAGQPNRLQPNGNLQVHSDQSMAERDRQTWENRWSTANDAVNNAPGPAQNARIAMAEAGAAGHVATLVEALKGARGFTSARSVVDSLPAATKTALGL